MLATRLADFLVRDRVLPMETVRVALERQLVYGGGLDTVLLEMGAVDEATLWGALSACDGLPIPEPSLLENADAGLAAVFDAPRWRACRAVPVGRHDDRVQLLCTERPDDLTLRTVSDALGLQLELFVAPEVRVAVAAQAVYGDPVSSRFLRLLARLLGAQRVRRWAEACAPQLPQATGASALPPPPAVAAAPPDSVVVDPSMTQALAHTDVPPAAEAAEATAIVAVASPAGPRVGAAPGSALQAVPRATTRGRESQRLPRVRRPAATILGVPPAAEPEGLAPLQQVLELSSGLMRATESLMEPRGATAKGGADDGQTREDHRTDSEISQEEKLCRIVDHQRADVRLAAQKALRGRLEHPRVRALVTKLHGDIDSPTPGRALRAVSALAELRDASAVPELIRHLKDENPALEEAALKALVEITKQDFGHSRRRWTAWWERHHDEGRIDWLFEGLAHKTAGIRAAACDELRLLTGEYFGYHFDLPKRERDEARERWESWWTQTGRFQQPAATGGATGPGGPTAGSDRVDGKNSAEAPPGPPGAGAGGADGVDGG